MDRRYFIIRHHPKDSSNLHKEEHSKGNSSFIKELKNIPYEVFANELMDDIQFIKYLQENGLHFTDKLLKVVMPWTNKPNWVMTDKEVKESLNQSNLILPERVNIYDFTYQVNHCSHVLNNHPDSFSIAFKQIATPPYEGFIFNRWLADCIGMGYKITWEDLV